VYSQTEYAFTAARSDPSRSQLRSINILRILEPAWNRSLNR